NEFHTTLTTVRKYGVSISLILQDIEQLTNTYGSSQAAIIMNGGTSSRLFLPGMSLESCKEVERLLGQATIEDIDFWTQIKEAPYGRSLLTAQEIRTMENGKGIFVHGNELPIQLDMIPYYTNSNLNCYTEIPPLAFIANQQQPVIYIPLPILPPSNNYNQGGNHQLPFFDL
ncbi:MAG: hypothetical protein COB67_09680, partial [SAR324 cluster bacterium]